MSPLHPAWIFPFFLSQGCYRVRMPIKGKAEKLLDRHVKQLLQTIESPYPADEEEGRKEILLALSLLHIYRNKLTRRPKWFTSNAYGRG